mgnify:CR=1 FL=1
MTIARIDGLPPRERQTLMAQLLEMTRMTSWF